MCRKSEGPSELIGSAGDKGGLLQRRKPTGRWSHKGGGEKERRRREEVLEGRKAERRGIRISGSFLVVFPPGAVWMMIFYGCV